jgi:hypothetical protein
VGREEGKMTSGARKASEDGIPDREYESVMVLVERLELKHLYDALDRIANMKNRDGVEIDMHREELRAIARTALRHNANVTGLAPRKDEQ